MTKINQLPVLEVIDNRVCFIDHGGWGCVYSFETDKISPSKRVAGKVLSRKQNSRVAIRKLAFEARIDQELYTKGISVPQPFGVFAISLPHFYPESNLVAAFVQELISGEKYDDLASFVDREQACRLHRQEITKARDLGYKIPRDHLSPAYNCLFRLEEDKVILFDFGNWQHAGLRGWLE